MKKIVTILTCTAFVSGCAYLADKFYEADENILAQKKDIIRTLSVFQSNCRYYPHNNPFLLYISDNKDAVCCQYTDEDNIKGYTYESCGMSKDKCIIFKRKHHDSSKICYFNYKKYLPEGVADNEQEFLALYNKYINYLDSIYQCDSNTSLTQAEKQDCQSDAANNFTNWAMSGGAKKQIKQEIKQKEIIKQKEKERQEANKAKLIAQNADCKQAIEKAKHHAEEINAKNLFVLDESKTSNQANHTGNWSFCLKVIDYDNAGIIVQSGCTASPLANILLNSFIGCEDKYYFIYTTDAYADRECYKNWEYFHEDAGVYTWKNKRIRAFKATKFKISETDYHTYLRDKTISQCDQKY